MIGTRYVDMPWQNVQVTGTEPPGERICKNCRFWSRPAERYSSGGVFGDCSSPKFNIGYSDLPNPVGDEVNVEGDEGWGFTTGPEFGCIHFREKDAPEGGANA